jgi:hypothetical protein
MERSKYPPAEPEDLRLLAPHWPLKGAFSQPVKANATGESKNNRISKCDENQNQGILPELSNFGSHPGRVGGLPF